MSLVLRRAIRSALHLKDAGRAGRVELRKHVKPAQVRKQVIELERLCRELPQVKLPVEHLQIAGVYVRKLDIPAGITIVGKLHKQEHVTIVARGLVVIANDTEPVTYGAGSTWVSRPGTKRAIHALEDSTLITVHRTDLVELAEIEAQLVTDAPHLEVSQ